MIKIILKIFVFLGIIFLIGCTTPAEENEQVREILNQTNQSNLIGEYKFGELVLMSPLGTGGIAYTISKIECCFPMKEQYYSQYYIFPNSAVFLKLYVSEQNIGLDGIVTPSASHIKLIDGYDRIYEVYTDYLEFSDNSYNSLSYEKLNPGLAKNGVLYYLVPQIWQVDIQGNPTVDLKVSITSEDLTKVAFVKGDVDMANLKKRIANFSDSGYLQETKTIKITNNGYNPQNITLYDGDSIKWINTDDKLHTISIYTCTPTKKTIFSKTIKVGDEVEYTFDWPNNYKYYCGNYQRDNPFDKGEIIVNKKNR